MEQELLVLLASAMTKEQIIERLEEAISEYREANLLNNEEQMKIKLHHLVLSCHLFIMHNITDGSMQGALDTIKKMHDVQAKTRIFEMDDKKN